MLIIAFDVSDFVYWYCFTVKFNSSSTTNLHFIHHSYVARLNKISLYAQVIQFFSPIFFCQVTALHMAAQGGHLSIVKFLVEMKAEVNVKGNAEVRIQIWYCCFI